LLSTMPVFSDCQCWYYVAAVTTCKCASKSIAEMMQKLLCASAASAVLAQQIGTNQAENHPPLTTYVCASDGTCNADTSTSIVLDQNWRWLHQVSNLRGDIACRIPTLYFGRSGVKRIHVSNFARCMIHILCNRQVGSDTNCYTGDAWDTQLCPDPTTCSQNCALDG
jgi:cellulose 1,4-beta-cellobiosidase